MGMARCNVPSVFLYGGSALPGRFRGKDVTILDVYEGVGSVLTGTLAEQDLIELEHCAVPTVSSCPGQFTANTMAMVAETLGIAISGGATTPAVFAERHALARESGHAVIRILKTGAPLPRDLITRKSLQNACAVVAPAGGSTNAVLHIPAIAHEAGIRFDVDDVAAVLSNTPLLADMKPGGRFLAKDLHAIGGVRVSTSAIYVHWAWNKRGGGNKRLQQFCQGRASRGAPPTDARAQPHRPRLHEYARA
jgi:dihydroxy-acid dehydratase